MNLYRQTLILVKHNLRLEWKNKYTMGSVFMHILVAVFITFMSFKVIDKPGWNSMYWLILIFTTLQGISKSFIGVNRGTYLYVYQLTRPESYILAKIITNMVLMALLSVCCFIAYGILMGNMADHTGRYLFTLLLSGLGISATYTIISSIAGKTDNATLLMPVLSMPVILPVILVGIKASKKAMDGIETNSIYTDWCILLILNVIILFLGLTLFKYLWKE